jgi:D-3-phosphoglycerate dehydrogenase
MPPTLSRWGRSTYDTEADLAADEAALAPWVRLRPPGSDAEILVVPSSTRVGAAALDAAPSARLVVTTTSGTDHLDLAALEARGVRAARLADARRDAVCESALELLLWGLRATGPLDAAAREGRWARAALPALGMGTLRGARVGVVGLGVIGREMARILGALGATVCGWDPAGVPDGVERAPVPALLASCAALTLHCSLTPSSRGLLSAVALSAARPGLVLVNTARGDVLDLPAAVDALDAGRLGALGVDVFPDEPWPGIGAVASRPRLRFTPHSSGYFAGLPAAVRAGLVATVSAWAEGRPLPHPVGA